MSSLSTNNLIGFLTKQSLFKTQIQKKGKIIQNSNEIRDTLSRSITPKNKNHSKSQISQFNVFNDRSQKQFSQKGFSQIDPFSSKKISNIILKSEQQNRFEKIVSQNLYLTSKKKISNKSMNPQSSGFLKRSIDKANNFSNDKANQLFMHFKPQSSAKQGVKVFESLQGESQKCLHQLQNRLQKEILILNWSLEQFNAKMLKVLNNELQTLKKKIQQMVEQAFKQSERNIKVYMKHQQNIFLSEVNSMRNQLQKQYQKVGQMKITIKTSEWRKTAAELITSDLQHKIEQIIGQSQKINIQPFKIDKTIQDDKLMSLNKAIKDLGNPQSWNQAKLIPL